MATANDDPVGGMSIGLEHSETKTLLGVLAVGGAGDVVGQLVKIIAAWGVGLGAAG